MKINQGKGKTTGLHKPYFNGSPAQSKSSHPIPTAPASKAPGSTNPGVPYNTPKGC